MVKKYTIEFEENTYGGVSSQEIKDEGNLIYSVGDLCECPEDATIARSLVSAKEIIDFIKLGIDLGKKGYTEIEVESKKVN